MEDEGEQKGKVLFHLMAHNSNRMINGLVELLSGEKEKPSADDPIAIMFNHISRFSLVALLLSPWHRPITSSTLQIVVEPASGALSVNNGFAHNSFAYRTGERALAGERVKDTIKKALMQIHSHR
jgi:hypothetical protein